MKIKKSIILPLFVLCSASTLAGCAARMIEEEINVVFMNEGSIVDSGVVTQFKNIKSPTIDDAYVPADYRFLGWTGYTLNQLDYQDSAHFKTQYIGGGRMVHYMEVEKFATNKTVVLEALILHKDDIPKEYHYAVIAWYDKSGTSGLTQASIDQYETTIKQDLLTAGVSQEDVNSILFRGYSGNVGPTTGQILFDGDVDIMLGWGTVDNITTTGSIPVAMIKQSEAYTIAGKNRYIHRLSDTVGSTTVMEHLLSDASRAHFAN